MQGRPPRAFIRAFEKVLPGDGQRWLKSLLLLDAGAVALREFDTEHVVAEVMSESEPGLIYDVTGSRAGGWECNCMDHQTRGGRERCKHIRAVKMVYLAVAGKGVKADAQS